MLLQGGFLGVEKKNIFYIRAGKILFELSSPKAQFSMARGITFEEIAKKLNAPSIGKETLINTLKTASTLLTEAQQSSSPETLSTIQPVALSLSKSQFINHKDKDVRLFVAFCISEILRIFAPDAPYDEPTLKDIFYLFLRVFQGLSETSTHTFSRTVTILETLATVKTCVVMLDLECDDLILEMFQLFFSVCSPNHPPNVFNSMVEVMVTIIAESENISQELLDTILVQLVPNKSTDQSTRSTAYQLAVSLLRRCADHLEPFLHRFLTNIMANKRVQNERPYDLHQIILEIYKAEPQLLVAVLPNMQEQLLIDQENLRLKTVNLLAKIFSLPDRKAAHDYRQLYSDFIGRFKDKSTEIRLTMVKWSESILSVDTIPKENAEEILSILLDRLLDFEEKVRMAVVKVICRTGRVNPSIISMDALKCASDRLWDKKLSVRRTALLEMVELYKTYCANCVTGKEISRKEMEWIPTKIIRCVFGKEFREKNQGLDICIEKDIFPNDLSVKNKCWHWMLMYSAIDDNDRKALKYFFSLKSRLNQEMLHYLDLRQKFKEDDRESNNEFKLLFKNMSTRFSNPNDANDCFIKLDKLKDSNVFKLLTSILDSKSTFDEAASAHDQLLKTLGDKNPLHEFMSILSCRISYLLFCEEHVKCFFQFLNSDTVKSNTELLYSTIALLQDLSNCFPFLFSNLIKEVHDLLNDDDEKKKELALNVLVNAGIFMQNNLTYLDPIKEKLENVACKGSRKQAKLSIMAICSVFDQSKTDVLNPLMDKLMTSLPNDDDNDDDLPTILQSISFIAQSSLSSYTSHEEDFVSFIVKNIFKRSSTYENGDKNDWEHPSKECLLKQYGLKAFVRSFLQTEGGTDRSKLKELLNLLSKLLSQGCLTTEENSSENDLAHLRLAAARSVLKLSQKWESFLSAKHFALTVLTSMDPVLEVRKEFLKNLHKYLFNKSLHFKYASAFILASSDSNHELAVQAKQWLNDLIEYVRNRIQIQKSLKGVNSKSEESVQITNLPEYLLVYFIFALSNYSNFPSLDSDASAFEPFLKQILNVLLSLLNSDESKGQKKDDEADNLPLILYTLRTMKNTEIISENNEKTQNMYALCDIALIIAKELGKKKIYSQSFHGQILLPTAMLKPLNLGDSAIKADESNLPQSLKNLDLEKLKSKVTIASSKPRPIAKKEGKRVKKNVEYSEESDKESEARGEKGKGKDKEIAASVENGPSKKKIKSDNGADSDQAKKTEKTVQEEKTVRGRAASGKFPEKDKNGTAQAAPSSKTPMPQKPSEALEGEDLVGKRVKVWWPDDKKYYYGTVTKFTASKQRHKVVYDDGDVENLVMKDEKWFVLESSSNEPKAGSPPRKRGRPSTKGALSEKPKGKPKAISSDAQVQNAEDAKKDMSSTSLPKGKMSAGEEKTDMDVDVGNSQDKRKRNSETEIAMQKKQKMTEKKETEAETGEERKATDKEVDLEMKGEGDDEDEKEKEKEKEAMKKVRMESEKGEEEEEEEEEDQKGEKGDEGEDKGEQETEDKDDAVVADSEAE